MTQRNIQLHFVNRLCLLGIIALLSFIIMGCNQNNAVTLENTDSTNSSSLNALPTSKVAIPILPFSTPAQKETQVPPASPAEDVYFVSQGGNNGNGKTWATAWNDLDQIKWDVISPGTTIYVRPGTYTTSLIIEKSGTSENPIAITGVGEVVIDGPGSGYGFSITNKQHIVISGFEFKDWERGIYITGSSGKTYSSSGASKYIVIENNKFYANDGRGIFVQTSDHITIRKNTVTTPELAFAQTDAIYSQRNHLNTYEGNTIIISNRGGGHNDGVQLFQDTDIIVRNNYIEQDNSKVNDAQGIFATEMYGSTLYYNNVVNMTNVKSNSITFKTQNGATVEIIGNTVYGVRPYHGIWVVGVADPIVKNNIVYLISGSTLDISGSSSGVSNNYTSNPEFSSVVDRDFRLQSTSPAIDAGVSLAEPYTVDIIGTLRPQGKGWDIGAFEYAND